MIDQNRKRYVYLDKYMEQQSSVMKKLSSQESKITALTFIAMGCIVVVSLLLYKIFG